MRLTGDIVQCAPAPGNSTNSLKSNLKFTPEINAAPGSAAPGRRRLLPMLCLALAAAFPGRDGLFLPAGIRKDRAEICEDLTPRAHNLQNPATLLIQRRRRDNLQMRQRAQRCKVGPGCPAGKA